MSAEVNSSTEADPAKLYIDYLAAEGYRPEIDKDGDVVFKKEGYTYIIIVDKGDEAFFRLCFPNFWRLSTEAEKQKAYVACNSVNRESKVAKVTVVSDNVWINIELYVPTRDAFKPLFDRSLRSITNAVKNFANNMKVDATPATK